jgi:hypothetical protein
MIAGPLPYLPAFGPGAARPNFVRKRAAASGGKPFVAFRKSFNRVRFISSIRG